MDNVLAAGGPAACQASQEGHRQAPPSRESIVSVRVHRRLLAGPLFISMRLKAYLRGVVRVLSLGVEDEDSEQRCWLGLARVAADRVDSAWRFGPALACPVDESRLRAGVGHRCRPRRVIDFHGDQRLASNIGNGRLEVLLGGFRFAIMSIDRAGYREGEGGAGGGDDGSSWAFSFCLRLVFLLHCFYRPWRPADCGRRTGSLAG
jgi:hypothetical protein